MAISCRNCGSIVKRDRETIVVSNDGWYAHRVGTCRGCGDTVLWHRMIAGRLGRGYMYLYSPPPRRCSASCPHYDQSAGSAARI